MADQNYILKLQKLTQQLQTSFSFYELFNGIMHTYGLSQSYIQQAWDNKSKVNCALNQEAKGQKLARADIGLQGRVLFRFVQCDEDVHEQLDQLMRTSCFQNEGLKIPLAIAVSPHYISLFSAISHEFCSFDLASLPQHFALLLPITVASKRRLEVYAPVEANNKACGKLIHLMDILEGCNEQAVQEKHILNSFMRRLVFCLFAEDTGLFAQDQFTQSFTQLTSVHGDDCQVFFQELFQVLNTPPQQRQALSVRSELLAFPYVDGALFEGADFIPRFSILARNSLIDCGRMKWSTISPAIFGSLFQYALDPQERRHFGVHYSPEENILKVIKPLFLDNLTAQVTSLEQAYQDLQEQAKLQSERQSKETAAEEVMQARSSQGEQNLSSLCEKQASLEAKVRALHAQLGNLKVLDPACGCGNFLVVSYRELRRLENRLLHLVHSQGESIDFKVSIEQFYGIEIEDWPSKIAQLSMWLMQHQLNRETEQEFGRAAASLPLSQIMHIHCGNALTMDWNELIPASECAYIIGNPPFIGNSMADRQQKSWLKAVYPQGYPATQVDYVSGWFVQAARYMQGNQRCRTALIATSSICNGIQVETLWTLLMRMGIFINFAYTPFIWRTETCVQGTSCIIVGFSYQDIRPAWIFKEQADSTCEKVAAQVISPYLIDEPTRTIVSKSRTALSAVHPMFLGSTPPSSPNYFVDIATGNELLQSHDMVGQYLKLFLGGAEFSNNTWRYYLSVDKQAISTSKEQPLYRSLASDNEIPHNSSMSSPSSSSNLTAPSPQVSLPTLGTPKMAQAKLALVMPRLNPERRSYLPLGLINDSFVIADSACFIPNPNLYDYAILDSRMHNIWINLTCGRRKCGQRYSKEITYNTFIWPQLNEQRKLELSVLGSRIFDFCSASKLTLAELTAPESMPLELKLLHEQLDSLVESYYRAEPFRDDEERIVFLIGLYRQRCQELQGKGNDKSHRPYICRSNSRICSAPTDKQSQHPHPTTSASITTTTSSSILEVAPEDILIPQVVSVGKLAQNQPQSSQAKGDTGKQEQGADTDAEEVEEVLWHGTKTGEDITPWLIPLNAPHIMVTGSTLDDQGQLQLSREEAIALLKEYPSAKRYLHRLISADSFYGGKERYGLWLNAPQATGLKRKGKEDPEFAYTDEWKDIPWIKQRVERCCKYRCEAAKDTAAYWARHKPFSFSKVTYPPIGESKLMLPRYIPRNLGYIPTWLSVQPYLADDTVCLVPTESILDCAVLNSRLHWVWMCATSKFKGNGDVYHYSLEYTYNNFIWPYVPDSLRRELYEATCQFMLLHNGQSAEASVEATASAGGRTVQREATDKVAARERLDLVVERCYRENPFSSDAERFMFLKHLYLKYKF